MKNKILAVALFTAVTGMGFSSMHAYADDTVGEKASEAAHDTGRAVKKGARAMKDKTCETVNGKVECAAKKMKHKAKNAAEKVEDATD